MMRYFSEAPTRGLFVSARGGRRVGLMDKLFRRPRKDAEYAPYFKTITDYAPAFTTWRGGVYEMELTRACVHAFAVSCSKLTPSISGDAYPGIRRAFETWPSPYMTWSRFLYRLATIYEVDCTAFAVPTYSANGEPNGFFPLKCDTCELVDYKGEMWARFRLPAGDVYAIEARKVCCISKYQYLSDYFGTKNNLRHTMDLLNAQVQAEKNAIDLGGKIMYIGKVTGMVAPEDQRRKRDEFYARNFTDNDTVLMTYDNTFENIQQVKASTYTISTDEMERIDKHVYSYFGCNEYILQNTCDEAKWDSYYEGKVEPFALMLSQGLTQACFTQRQVKAGNSVEFGADRLQFMGAATKRNIVRDMTGCGVMTVNEGRAVLNLPPIDGMDVFMVRGEFYQLSRDGKVVFASGGKGVIESDPSDDPDFDLGGDDQIYNDADTYGSVDEDGSN